MQSDFTHRGKALGNQGDRRLRHVPLWAYVQKGKQGGISQGAMSRKFFRTKQFACIGWLTESVRHADKGIRREETCQGKSVRFCWLF